MTEEMLKLILHNSTKKELENKLVDLFDVIEDNAQQIERLEQENELLKEKVKILEAKNFEKCPFRYSDIGCDYCDWKDRDLKYEVEE